MSRCRVSSPGSRHLRRERATLSGLPFAAAALLQIAEPVRSPWMGHDHAYTPIMSYIFIGQRLLREIRLINRTSDSRYCSGPKHRHQPKSRRSGVCMFTTQLHVAAYSTSQTTGLIPRSITIRAVRGAAQRTASLFAAATVFFGSVSSSTPSLYLAWAVASSTS
jgi:hypothetical protein